MGVRGEWVNSLRKKTRMTEIEEEVKKFEGEMKEFEGKVKEKDEVLSLTNLGSR